MAAERSVTICMPLDQHVEAMVQFRAQGSASRIYRAIGVELKWKQSCMESELDALGTSSDPNLETVGVEWAAKAPASLSRAALACARPFQATGNRVTLYLDRLGPMLEERPTAATSLGHVLAHEIGHVLLGYNDHAREGLMKAHWTGVERGQMQHRLLSFSEEDAAAIRRRLDRRGMLMMAGIKR